MAMVPWRIGISLAYQTWLLTTLSIQDSHCKHGLICYQRDKEGESVPGCSGHPNSSKPLASWQKIDTKT
jgi:hypothetical protein